MADTVREREHSPHLAPHVGARKASSWGDRRGRVVAGALRCVITLVTLAIVVLAAQVVSN
ncbi:MAG: hypothetical protein ACRDU0_12485 [Mycobacterium sp.]